MGQWKQVKDTIRWAEEELRRAREQRAEEARASAEAERIARQAAEERRWPSVPPAL